MNRKIKLDLIHLLEALCLRMLSTRVRVTQSIAFCINSVNILRVTGLQVTLNPNRSSNKSILLHNGRKIAPVSPYFQSSRTDNNIHADPRYAAVEPIQDRTPEEQLATKTEDVDVEKQSQAHASMTVSPILKLLYTVY